MGVKFALSVSIRERWWSKFRFGYFKIMYNKLMNYLFAVSYPVFLITSFILSITILITSRKEKHPKYIEFPALLIFVSALIMIIYWIRAFFTPVFL